MSGDVVGPPPGLVPSDAGSVEPPDAPPPPSFGGGGRTMSAQSHPVGGLSDDSSHVWAPDADDGAAEQRQTGEESTRYEWNAGDGADRSRGNGRPHQDDRTFEDVAAAYSRRVSWETTTAGSTREGRHRYWQEEDPWVMYGDPWQREAKTQGALEGFLGWMGVMVRMEAVIQQAIAGIPGQMIETQGTTDKIQEAIKGVSGRMAEMDTTAYTIMADLLAGMKVQGMAQIQGPGRTTAAMTPMATTSGLLPGEGKKKEFEGRAQPSASRQIEVWKRITRLSTPEGLGYFTSWISARFLDLEVARIGKAFSDFFSLHHLQHAAVLHDRGQRKPWESGNPKGRRPNFAHLTNHETDEDEDYENNDHEIPQEVAEALMTYQSAKEKYRSQQRARGSTEVDKNAKGEDHSGSDPRGGNGGGDREAKVRAMKARSFCGGCGRRGHWHKDDECPLNKGGGASKGDHGAKNVAMTNVMPADVYTLKHMSDNLVGVADTACARTVAGSQWLQSYTNVLATMGEKPLLQKECEAYKFGTGKVHFSSFYVIVNFKLGGYIIQVRTSIITGDIPLLLSKTVLGKMGMIYDVQGGKADFRAINLMNYELATTASGHPAIPIVPVSLPPGGTPDLQVEDLRLQRTEQYMAVFAVAHQALQPPEYSGIFYDKKLDPSTRNMLSQDRLPLDVFLAWWEKSAIRRDFWVEPQVLAHAIPVPQMDEPPCKEKAVPLSRMTKPMLLSEAVRVGATVHHSWSVQELRATIREHNETYGEKTATQRMKGLSSLNLPELIEKAKELNVMVPERTTKGALLKLIRSTVSSPADTLVTFGRWKGSTYREVPDEYGRWAATEVTRSPNCSVELMMFAKWWKEEQQVKAGRTKIKEDTSDYEDYQKEIHSGYANPPRSHNTHESPAKAKSTATSSRGSWEEVSAYSRECHIPTGKGNAKTTSKRTNHEIFEKTTMDAKADPGVLDEIAALETKLAILKDKASRDAGEVHCCGSVCCTEIITEEEYNYGLKNRALNYEGQHLPNFTGDTFEHNERSDHTRGASTSEVFQQCGAAGQPPGDVGRAPPLRYGDGNYDWEDYTFSNCQRILEDNAYPQGKPSMRAVQHGEGDPEGQIYVTYGLFTHGGVHGLTRASKDNDAILRYLNNLGREHLGDEATWTSISVTRNIGVSVHRDSNNLKDSKNYTVTFGQDAGGDIWMEEDVDENQVHGKGIVWKRDRTGAWVPGRYYNDKEHFIDFNPFRRHASEEWTGDRWCLTYHTVRGVAKIGGELKKYLGRAGFPVPKVNIDGKYKAVDLSKTVIEPMMWKDFLNPEVQKTAYHFVREDFPDYIEYKFVDNEDGWMVLSKRTGDPQAAKKDVKYDGSGITFETGVPKIVQASLRLAGCEPHVIKAVKGMKCETCDATRHAQVARPTTFNAHWLGPFGPPVTVSLDLDGKVQAGLGRLCEWHNIKVQDVAAQAKWQGGVTERQIGWFKGIWERVVHDMHVQEDEAELAGTMVCAAKNELRKRTPDDLCDPDSGEAVTWDLTKEMIVYVEDYYNGLTAPEHLRSSGPEEIGEYLTMKGVKTEVEKLLAMDVDDPTVFVDEEDSIGQDYREAQKRANDGVEHLSDYELTEPDVEMDAPLTLDPEGDHEMDEEPQEGEVQHIIPKRRARKKIKPTEAMLTHKPLTKRGQAKRQEKELKWQEIPDHAKALFKDAEKVQWQEHLAYDALEPLSLDLSQKIKDTVDPSRILPCRWAYRDQNWAARKAVQEGQDGAGEQPAWRCKSRLVIGGHRDPDLGVEDLSTDAPTLSRPGFMCLMQLLANGLEAEDKWIAAAGDIQCAFLTGGYLARGEDLFLHQPRTGFPNLLPGQLVRIKKNIFGLATSPHEWWLDLQAGMYKAEVDYHEETYKFDQCPLDPCIFVLKKFKNGKFEGRPLAYVGSHVDDLLIIAGKKVNKLVQGALSSIFPIDKWEENHLDYIGSEIICGENEILVTQQKYAETRLFTLEVPRGADEEDQAGPDLIADNQSLIGALSWLSAQTRPDLTCSVSLAQQLQKAPTIADIKFTNVISARALEYKAEGLRFRPIPDADFGIIVYHDAAWANALLEDEEDEDFKLTASDHENGLQREGPFGSHRERKAKRLNSKVASQIGALVLFADMNSVKNGKGAFSIGDWRSRAGQRVCRSTFGAETQACVEGLEGAQYMRSFIETLKDGVLRRVEQGVAPILCLSDCRSLFDHVHKQGIPRVPTDRRLAIDLAALRQSLRSERWGAKLPLGW
ncbi:RE1, partial [Symbiodinium sp. KB8]